MLYLTMILGYAALLAMLVDGMRHATLRRFATAAVLVATAWFSLCLAVLG